MDSLPKISIHTPLAGSDSAASACSKWIGYFNPHSPCGERLLHPAFFGERRNFNPHSPCGERPQRDGLCMRSVCDFNPHSPCGERPKDVRVELPDGKISIHTPLAGSDCGVEPLWRVAYPISIHTPLAGSDMPPVTAGLNRLFQSTLPLRGATSTRYPRHPRNRFQSTLPLRGATRGRTGARLHRSISIHTPLAGSDFLIYANS